MPESHEVPVEVGQCIRSAIEVPLLPPIRQAVIIDIAPEHTAKDAIPTAVQASAVPDQGNLFAPAWMIRFVLPSSVMMPLSACGFSQRTRSRSEVSIQAVSTALSR